MQKQNRRPRKLTASPALKKFISTPVKILLQQALNQTEGNKPPDYPEDSNNTEQPEEPSLCNTHIIPFDCHQNSCDCPDVVISEGCGIRDEDQGDDPVFVGYQAHADHTIGRYEVERINPDSKKITRGSIICHSMSGLGYEGCLNAFTVSQISGSNKALRPISLSFSLPNVGGKLRPFTNRELYTITLWCRSRRGVCSDSITLPVYDCKLMKLCYNFGFFQAGLDFWKPKPGNPFPTDRVSIRQFCAMLGENGVSALSEKYYHDATNCERFFQNPGWAAGVSAVLAEEFANAFVLGIRPGDWAPFFAGIDKEMTPDNIDMFMALSLLFGIAHLRRGLQEALLRLGSNPCCIHDLNLIANTLVNAQRIFLDNYKGFALMIDKLLKKFHMSPIDIFEYLLKSNMLEALGAQNEIGCARGLKKLWQM